jgi:hypothetical protein
MDPIPLVSEQIEAGAKLVARLVQGGFPVKAAAWVKESDGGNWYLYLVSPVRDRRGPIEGYRQVLTVLRQMLPSLHVGRLDVKLIRVADPVGKELEAIRDRVAGRTGEWFRGNYLGEVEIDAAYVYAPIVVSSASDAAQGVV